MTLNKSGSSNNDVYTATTQWSVTCNPTCGAPVNIGTQNNLIAINNGHYNGVNTPYYFTKRRRGDLLPMTPFRKFRVEGTSSGNFNVDVGTGGSNHIYYYFDNGLSAFQYWVLDEDDLNSYAPESYDEYVQSAAAAIYSSGHDTLTFLAELMEVKRMFFQTGRRLLTLDVPRNWRRLTNDYLEYRYGWRVLMYDLKSLNNAVKNLNNGVQRYKECRGTTSTTSNDTSWTGSLAGRVAHHSVTDEVTIGKRGCVVADLDVPEFQFNPLVTAWELIPYSFVVDWFLTVGQSLAALSFLILRPQFVASAGLYVEVKRTYSMYCDPNSNDLSIDMSQNAEATGRLWVREPSTVSLTPRITLDISIAHIVDLIALIIQRI